MSRIGKLPISIPEKVTITVSDDNTVTVKGPKGELSQKVDASIAVNVEDGQITFTYAGGKTVQEATKQEHAYHGLYRALINNMVTGVSTGFKKELELVGVGYRVNEKPCNTLELILGYTHSIYMQLPAEVKIETKSERNKNPLIILESCDKQLLGMVCAKIRSFRKPEPYKGKGVKFVGEVIRRKSGKSAGAK
ncbi:MAG: 50S ribosomal protein L6 [Bacteroidaceae bacterium]|nr:50S ribosomal protein L6 [Bacteroidales bacterium]MBQ3189245.1 50S ribosomal protein L6 [Bacteroidaceae bacterium]MBQ3623265.1 50S ribosomal protein L6 [Bacteroidaceae bacterium]MBQ6939492.1 50S ribosomal protein L6 [Muribaculaceae bacterium]